MTRTQKEGSKMTAREMAIRVAATRMFEALTDMVYNQTRPGGPSNVREFSAKQKFIEGLVELDKTTRRTRGDKGST